MVRPFSGILFSGLLLLVCSTCFAQTAANIYDFVPGEKMVFEDNFHTDKISSFPARWEVAVCSDAKYNYAKSSWTVQKGDENYLLRSTTTFLHVSPIIKPQLYPRDSFTVEFDCLFEDPTSCAELYFAQRDKPEPCKEVSFHILSWGKMVVHYPGEENKYSATFPGDFDYTQWHHFSLSYCGKLIRCYLDGHAVLKIPDCEFLPGNISLGCIAPVKFSHFSIATISSSGSVNDILTKKKFVTHAIHFPQGRSVIKPESMGIIGELVNFLVNNPTIKLRIDGHTDNDGSTGSNMLLSEARAQAVRRLLIDRGIDELRLSTKGFGASKPIRSNTSAENKAENRRVEFVQE